MSCCIIVSLNATMPGYTRNCKIRKIGKIPSVLVIPMPFPFRFVDYREWPSDHSFPPYCNGWVYAIQAKNAPALAKASRITPKLFIDDLYVSGILRQRLNMSLVQVGWTPWYNRLFRCISELIGAESESRHINTPIKPAFLHQNLFLQVHTFQSTASSLL